MVLSPLLPDVQSLCLNNTVKYCSAEIKNFKPEKEALQTINQESLKELLYGPSNNT